MNAEVVLDKVCVDYLLHTVQDLNLKRFAIDSISHRKRRNASLLRSLDNISFSIGSGTRLAIKGPNGSGKTTLLRVIAGALTPTSGFVSITGKVFPLLGGPGATLDLTLTGIENIITLGIKLGEPSRSMKSKIDEISDFSGLGDRLRTPVGTYSNGMIARLRFSIITALNPQILVIDEGIASSTDPDFSSRAVARLQEFKKRTEIVIFSSHSSGLDSMTNESIELSAGTVVGHKRTKLPNSYNQILQLDLDPRVSHISDQFRSDEFAKKHSYRSRAKSALVLASRFDLDISSVLDLGCGSQELRSLLPEKSLYKPADIVRRSPDTDVVDLNKKQFPSGFYTTTFLLGVGEYLKDLGWVLSMIARHSRSVVMTYDLNGSKDDRRGRGWVTDYSAREVTEILRRSGFESQRFGDTFWYVGISKNFEGPMD